MKKTEDYLHLYLGCECIYTERSLLPNEHFYLTVGVFFWAYSHTDEYKPILRPLSDMSEEESEKYDSFYAITPYNIYDEVAYQEAERTLWLLSKQFDLFNLITEGLAIDKTTL